MKKSDLKQIIAECTRAILAEMETIQQPSVTEEREETFYQDARGREGDAANARHELEIIKRAGLDREYEALMNGIFNLPIREFDKRAEAIHFLKKRAFQMVGEPLQETSTTSVGSGGSGDSVGSGGYNVPGFLAPPGKGGSPRGVKGSPTGYSLSSIGKKDMSRGRDALLENAMEELKRSILRK